MSDPKPSLSLNNPTDLLAQKIEAQVHRWRHNRQLYPGWIVAPFENRRALWRKTENWMPPILAEVSMAPPDTRLIWLRELTWRYETCLMPLFGDYADKIEQALQDAVPFSELSSFSIATLRPRPENIASLDWYELSDAWIALALSLVRYRREAMEIDRFEALAASLAPLAGAYPEIASFLAYQRCILALERLDHLEARRIVASWDSAALPDPFWAARRAAIRAEIGDTESAEKEADAALRAVREMGARGAIGGVADAESENVDALSREGWAMMLVGGIKLGQRLFSREPTPDYRGRWEQLALFRCNPWADLEWLQTVLSPPPPISPDTATSGNRLRLIGGHKGTFQRLQPALQVVRLLEDAGYPVRALGVKLGAELLERAIEWLSPELPGRALPLLLRLREDKPLDSFLSDYRVATFTNTEVDRARGLALSALNQAVRVFLSVDRTADRGNWDAAQQRVQTALRVLKGLVVRLKGKELHDTLTRALELRRHSLLAADYDVWGLLGDLIARSLAGMSRVESGRETYEIMSQPLLGTDYRTIENQWTDDPTFHFFRRLPVLDRDAVPAHWGDTINRLIRTVADGPETARAQAALRCGLLHRIGALNQKEADSLLDATWGQPS